MFGTAISGEENAARYLLTSVRILLMSHPRHPTSHLPFRASKTFLPGANVFDDRILPPLRLFFKVKTCVAPREAKPVHAFVLPFTPSDGPGSLLSLPAPSRHGIRGAACPRHLPSVRALLPLFHHPSGRQYRLTSRSSTRPFSFHPSDAFLLHHNSSSRLIIVYNLLLPFGTRRRQRRIAFRNACMMILFRVPRGCHAATVPRPQL